MSAEGAIGEKERIHRNCLDRINLSTFFINTETDVTFPKYTRFKKYQVLQTIVLLLKQSSHGSGAVAVYPRDDTNSIPPTLKRIQKPDLTWW